MTNNMNNSLPLDTKCLKDLTGGQDSMQQELLDIFFLNVAECLELMERVCNDGYCDKWRDAAEELKNLSASLGAFELSKVCVVAENIANSNTDEKKRILANLHSNVHKLRVFVRNTRY